MEKKITLVFAVIGLIIIAAVALMALQLPSPKPDFNKIGAPENASTTIKITDSGFVPNEIKIKKGDTVKFVNEGKQDHWPAADKHPSHNEYPDKGGCIGSKFDSCRPLKQGEAFLFTFNFEGAWNFHDHLNPSFIGTVIVESSRGEEGKYSVSIVSATNAANVSDKTARIDWKITGADKTITGSAIYYDYDSHSGSYDLSVAPDLAGYTNHTKNYQDREIDIPNTLSADLSLDQVGTLYYRAYAAIDGKHYWTEERKIIIKE